MIREVQISDAQSLADIYNYYVENTVITFDELPLSEDEMAQKIIRFSEKYPFIILEENATIQGFAYATEWKAKSAYRNSAEITIYLHHELRGKKLGSLLFRELLSRLKDRNLHCLVGGITLPNEASIALHEKFGFRKVAEFKEIGYKFNQWLNVGYWELIMK